VHDDVAHSPIGKSAGGDMHADAFNETYEGGGGQEAYRPPYQVDNREAEKLEMINSFRRSFSKAVEEKKTDGSAEVRELSRKLGEAVKNKYGMIYSLYKDASAWPDTMYSFEPRGFRQKCSSLF